ncbi:hypothetical protein L1887_46219 [Cichorium endivia]|nr:hypothetical protein L1887_46219 [Cichorium endivia]
MTGRNRRNFSPDFRLEAAQLVLDQHYTVAAAATAMNVGKSTMDKWVRQLKEERAGKSPIASPMAPEQIEIRELKKRLQRVEMERDILKKATALLMSDSLNNSHYNGSAAQGKGALSAALYSPNNASSGKGADSDYGFGGPSIAISSGNNNAAGVNAAGNGAGGSGAVSITGTGATGVSVAGGNGSAGIVIPGKAAIGRLKDGELAKYIVWLDYLDALYAVDVSNAPDIKLPAEPDA